MGEDAHHSLSVLHSRRQEELLTNELHASQMQAAQANLIRQFRKQRLDFLGLPLCPGKLWSVRQPRARGIYIRFNRVKVVATFVRENSNAIPVGALSTLPVPR